MQLSDAKYNLFLISTSNRPRNINQIPNSFQISRLQKPTNYRPRICYQNATRNQPPKSELLKIANRYQTKKLSDENWFLFLFYGLG